MAKKFISKDEMYDVHPRIPDLYTSFQEGKISRRRFIRVATLLGMSAAVATACGGNNQAGTETEGETGGATEGETEGETGGATGAIKRGGILTLGTSIQLLDHPARLSWVEGANVVRQVAEYLTFTDAENITTPYLLDRWEANDDVTEWTLYLRQGILFNNGQELTADDVMFNFSQWLDPEIGSSMLGLLSYLDGMNSVEKVDDYTVKLNLTTPNIGVPENLFHYPAVIVPRDFEGDFIQQPVGTGPFTLEEYADGERAVLKARTDYWQMGEDGNPLPYIDEIRYIDQAKDASVAAIQSGQIDSFYQPLPANWQALSANPDMEVKDVSTAQNIVLRCRVDVEPWSDIRVMNALKMCQDRQQVLQLAYFNEGDLSSDAHVAPVHPAFVEQPIPEYDPEGARQLLEEWAADTGNELPLRATIATKNDEGEAEFAQALVEMAAPGGFEFELDITQPDGYWERWTEVPLGITAWTHRPLDTMVLALAYTADAEGTPVPWNETRWVDDEFVETLKTAEATVDPTERQEHVDKLMKIFQERGPVGISFYKKQWRINRPRVKGLVAHPTSYDFLTEVWIDDEA